MNRKNFSPVLALLVTSASFLCLSAPKAWGGIQEVRLDAAYLAAGDKAAGRVILTEPGDLPKGARLRVSVVRQVDLPANAAAVAGTTTTLLTERALDAATTEVPFEIDTAGMLAGTLRVEAAIVPAKDQPPVSTGWSDPVTVGIRHHLSLAGAWTVTKVEPLEFEDTRRPKDWKAPAFDKPITLPGTVTPDPFFRGWVTVRRDVTWPAQGKLEPRAVRLSGVSDSALVRVNDVTVGEVQPESELDCDLSHWGEFHSQFKGDANKRKRLLTYDSVVLPPMTMVFPKPVTTGTATVEMTIRGTSGAMRQKPPYGVFGDLCLEMLPPVFVKSVTFDTEKPGEKRRFKFQVTFDNQSGAPFQGKLRSVYGQYAGELPYTGACPAYASAEQDINLPVGETTLEVDRDEMPRFDTCRATFLVLGKDEQVLDAGQQDFHTVVVEIRNRRDLYLNNERFIVKVQGSSSHDANNRFNLRVNGVNGFRGLETIGSRQFPGLSSEVDSVNERYRDGLLTSAGPLLASCEACSFWNPQDTGNVTRAVQKVIRELGQCPGIFEWEATNELFGEPDEARIAIQEAFHKFDPYHRPVLATKSGGEWEAVAHDGRVPGVDIVGCQYLLSEDAVHSVTAAVTEQPLVCSEVNWNDTMLMEHNMWETWLNNGLSGALLFDYSGHASDQPVPLIPPVPNGGNHTLDGVFIAKNRQLFQDLVPTARRQADGDVLLTLANQMPYRLENLKLYLRELGTVQLPSLAPGDAANVLVPAGHAPPDREPVVARVEYTTHAGLKHLAILTPAVEGVAK